MTRVRLNRRLTLESPVRASDGAGGFVETWTPLGVHWAAVLPRSGRESSSAGTAVSLMSYRIILRATPVGAPSRPMPEQRFRDGSRVYRIGAVSERDDDGRYLVCFAEEEVAT
jgi:SPP1 family predicted phage head-tail adaptor